MKSFKFLLLASLFFIGSQTIAQTKTANISTFTQSSKQFSQLNKILQKSGYDKKFENVHQVTVFAPNDNAFGNISESEMETLYQNKSTMGEVFINHTIKGNWSMEKLMVELKNNGGKKTFTTIGRKEITIMLQGQSFVIENAKGKKAKVVSKPTVLENGAVVYEISTVL